MYNLLSYQFLPITKKEAWEFFSNPENLAKITPPEFNFEIKENFVGEIYKGQVINYRVSPLFGIPISWKSQISYIKEYTEFSDRQLVGPYKSWNHLHTFNEVEGGVTISDRVLYEMPFGLFGKAIHFLFVRKKLESMFKYREHKLKELFGQ